MTLKDIKRVEAAKRKAAALRANLKRRKEASRKEGNKVLQDGDASGTDVKPPA